MLQIRVNAQEASRDGFPMRNTVASDLKKMFLDSEYDLLDDLRLLPHSDFIPGDAFESNTLRIVPPFKEPPWTQMSDLTTLTSLAHSLGTAQSFMHRDAYSRRRIIFIARAPASYCHLNQARYCEDMMRRGVITGCCSGVW
ncbi:hypothetical protein BS17DRAFT_517217 [Gyrodon lividus]|nr:hypothetical protein BS17DRAFT_517217 [Gyrodon lividus]